MDTTECRKDALKYFEEGKLNILISTLLGEGVDIPNIQVLVFASPMRGIVKVLQKIGRGMRKHESKDKVIVYDLVDSGSKYFVNQARSRKGIYKKEGFDIQNEHSTIL